MPYPSFTTGKPVIADTGGDVITRTRENLHAVRDAVVVGAMEDWAMTPSGGTAAQPTQLLYSKGAERLKVTVTWGTSGGANGNPTAFLYEYSSNSGGLYDTIGTKTLSYDANGELTGVSWT